jgi:hypothetical protein
MLGGVGNEAATPLTLRQHGPEVGTPAATHPDPGRRGSSHCQAGDTPYA